MHNFIYIKKKKTEDKYFVIILDINILPTDTPLVRFSRDMLSDAVNGFDRLISCH